MLYKADSPNDYGGEAIAALIKEMSDGSGDIAIMVAGYPKEMDSFINSNPGLKSRFRNFYHFDDYTPTELVAIAKFAAKKKDVILNKNAEIKLKKIVTDAYRKRDRTFGNARMVFSMIDEAKMNLGIRLVRDYKPKEVTKELLTLIQEQDIEDLSQKDFNKRIKLEIDNSLLEEALEELNYLTGLEVIKQEVHDLISLTKYYRELDRDILKAFSMHSVFLGNPGTGKTTVARIMGKVYKALGLLERGHLIEADGGDLIAGYIGQTSIKTKELIKKAMGGILFIDEAYAITESSSGSNDYGKKAIAALIKEMEDHRGEFGLIVAGYTDNMKGFLEANPGMKSRFDRTFHFQDFTEEELWNIAVSMFAKKGLKADKKATGHIKVFIKNLYQNRSKFFGNARSIRKMVEKSYRNQELRMAKLDKSKRTKKMMETLVLEDVLEFDMSKIEISKRKSVGFK
jgi:SpoVK/Ycf46/Vps4 family AAA+-type ATPase